jgi:hypothetical protein
MRSCTAQRRVFLTPPSATGVRYRRFGSVGFVHENESGQHFYVGSGRRQMNRRLTVQESRHKAQPARRSDPAFHACYPV